MFGKLLKHEWKSNAPIMAILSGIALVLGLVAAFALRYLLQGFANMDNESVQILLLFPLLILFYVGYFALVAYFAASQYILLFRFYGSRFTDRGYLTFTLPVSAHANFLSAALNMLIWLFIGYGIFSLTITTILLVGASTISDFTLKYMVGSIFNGFRDLPPAMAIILLYMLFVLPAYTVIMNMTAVVTACTVFKRLKVLGCILFLYGFQLVSGVAMAFVTFATLITTASIPNFDPNAAMAISYSLLAMLMTLFTVGGYFLSTYLMKKKLNLS